MKKVFSILLALVFLTSNIGFALGTHYCGDHAVINRIVLGSQDLDCGMGMSTGKMDHFMPQISEKNCCDNVFQDLKIKDNYNPGAKVKTTEIQFALLFAVTFAEIFESPSSKISSFADYTPPPLKRDIPVLFQSFLI